jgi:hypothetical protein
MLDPKQRDAIAISLFCGPAEISEHRTELKSIVHWLLQDIKPSALKTKNRCVLPDSSSKVVSWMKPIPSVQLADPLDYVQASSEAVTTVCQEPVGEFSLVHRLVGPGLHLRQ